MLVGTWMAPDPITIKADVGIDDALHLMKKHQVRRLPVLDDRGALVGIVSDKDLLHAAPSPATSLSVHELRYLLAKLTIKRVMASPVITVSPVTPLEEAARIMVDNKIGGVPVLEQGKLVGIITETDIFKVLLDVLGARVPGVRFALAVHEGKGILASLTKDILDLGGNIISLVTSEGDSPDERLITVKVNDVDAEALRDTLESHDIRVLDFREA